MAYFTTQLFSPSENQEQIKNSKVTFNPEIIPVLLEVLLKVNPNDITDSIRAFYSFKNQDLCRHKYISDEKISKEIYYLTLSHLSVISKIMMKLFNYENLVDMQLIETKCLTLDLYNKLLNIDKLDNNALDSLNLSLRFNLNEHRYSQVDSSNKNKFKNLVNKPNFDMKKLGVVFEKYVYNEMLKMDEYALNLDVKKLDLPMLRAFIKRLQAFSFLLKLNEIHIDDHFKYKHTDLECYSSSYSNESIAKVINSYQVIVPNTVISINNIGLKNYDNCLCRFELPNEKMLADESSVRYLSTLFFRLFNDSPTTVDPNYIEI